MLIAILLLAYPMVRAVGFDSQPLTACYQTDGSSVELRYVDTGTTDYYPVAHDETVTEEDGFTVVTSRVTLQHRPFRLYLPGVRNDDAESNLGLSLSQVAHVRP